MQVNQAEKLHRTRSMSGFTRRKPDGGGPVGDVHHPVAESALRRSLLAGERNGDRLTLDHVLGDSEVVDACDDGTPDGQVDDGSQNSGAQGRTLKG